MNDQGSWRGMQPARPPAALRERVLAAAREAAARPAPGLLAALYHDRLLRLCAAGLATLVMANALVAGGGGKPSLVAAPTSLRYDDAVSGDVGLTAAEQLDDLAPVLGDFLRRSRG